MCTEVEDSSVFPLTDTSPSSQVYEEVGNNLREDMDPDDYTFPNVIGKDSEGYVIMVSNVKDEDAYGYTLPNVTFHNVIRTTSIYNKDENLVPNIFNESRFEFSIRLLDESTQHHSIELSSSDGILSNISCTLPIESSQSSTLAVTTFFLAQPNPSSKQKTTLVVPFQPDPSPTQKTAPEFSTQPDPSPDTSSEDHTSLLPYTTPPPFWQPSNPTTVGSQSMISSAPRTTVLTIALAVSVSVVVLISITVVAVASIWRQAFKSKRGRTKLDTIKDCSDSTGENSSTHAIHLNHEYENTIPISQTSMCTEVEDSSVFPLTDTSPSSQVYEEVGNNLREDTDADDYTFPYVIGKDSEGYVIMVSNVKDEDAYGYTLPNVTFHNVIRTTSIDNKDENLVPNVRCCKGRTMSSTKDTHTYDDKEEEGYIYRSDCKSSHDR
eukprot:XP_011665331.1 PREDICTED: uncharacterized protein LOC105438785 [Strongylocentrotus purpuratus]